MSTYLYAADLPNQLKSISIDKCFNIISYSFQCSRSLNDLGLPYGPTLPSILEFTLKAGKAEKLKPFYEQLSSPKTSTYNFLFDPTFRVIGYDSSSNQLKLKTISDGMTVRGNLIDLVDVYSTNVNDEANQMMVTVKVLINEIVFFGEIASQDQCILKTY